MEPIPLSDPYLNFIEPTFRKIKSEKISFLLYSLLAEESSVKYRSIATELLQTIARKKTQVALTACILNGLMVTLSSLTQLHATFALIHTIALWAGMLGKGWKSLL